MNDAYTHMQLRELRVLENYYKQRAAKYQQEADRYRKAYKKLQREAKKYENTPATMATSGA